MCIKESVALLYTILQNYPFRVDYACRHDITDLDLERLSGVGIRGLILDLDNTLMLPRTGQLSIEIHNWLLSAQNIGMNIILLSNNKNQQYMDIVRDFFEPMGIELISHGAKPYKANIQKCLNKLNTTASETLIVGDRALTDILGGLHCDIRTALVPPLIGNLEPLYKRIGRAWERSFLGSPKAIV